ncbi:hypothetical protein B0H19DRAFT_1084173 [Mycena capillaripes]|nr:hypothetical protein B0H19DRAFT_1084173 [Mycena capillaripes]
MHISPWFILLSIVSLVIVRCPALLVLLDPRISRIRLKRFWIFKSKQIQENPEDWTWQDPELKVLESRGSNANGLNQYFAAQEMTVQKGKDIENKITAGPRVERPLGLHINILVLQPTGTRCAPCAFLHSQTASSLNKRESSTWIGRELEVVSDGSETANPESNGGSRGRDGENGTQCAPERRPSFPQHVQFSIYGLLNGTKTGKRRAKKKVSQHRQQSPKIAPKRIPQQFQRKWQDPESNGILGLY